MSFKVFYAWQSDLPNNFNRGFIRSAIEAAVMSLSADAELIEAVREFKIDHDTKDVPGSPAIAETILSKIRECDVFICDLSTIDPNASRKAPNPNVLLEYGYALAVVGEQRIIAITNAAYSDPKDLPFDLQHKRWPISYCLGEDSSSDSSYRSREKDRLQATLSNAIKAIVQTFAIPASEIQKSSQNTTADGFVQISGDTLSIHPIIGSDPDSPESMPLGPLFPKAGPIGKDTRRDITVILPTGPFLSIRFVPRVSTINLSNVQARETAQHSLQPLAAHRSDGWSFARNQHGVLVYTFLDDDVQAITGSQLFRNGEIRGFNFYHLSRKLLGDLRPNCHPVGSRVL
jgi:hypothetical protein